MTDPTDFLRVSYSSLNTFSSCQRKFEFSKLYPQRPRDYDSFAADVGTALHRGYQDYLIHGDKDRAVWEFMQEYPYGLEYDQTNDYRSLEAALSTLEEMFESVAMAEYELATIRRPATPAELDRVPDIASYDVPAIEVPFEIRFKGITLPDGRGIAFVGFIDAILRNVINGRYKTTDIKTHRRALNDATPKFKFDDQQTPYGIIVEHIQGNAIESFDIQYLDCYVDLTEPTVKLYPFVRTKAEVQEWLTNKVLQFQSIQRSMQMDYFPRTSGGCLFYNRPCGYITPCESRDREMVEAWLLMGDEPAPPRLTQPWVIAEIDVFGSGEEA